MGNFLIKQKKQDLFASQCWKTILEIVNQYNNQGKLIDGWSVIDVDAILSKWVDIPRNQDELNRVIIWSKKILDSKIYNDHIKLMKMIKLLKTNALTY